MLRVGRAPYALPVQIDLVTTPSALSPEQVRGRAVVVIDAIRATTTMLHALSAGATEVHVFAEIEECRAAAEAFGGPKLLAGERRGAPIAGFDLGNAPADFSREAVEGKRIFMTTTNGTKAILAAAGAHEVLIGAFVNRSALARRLRELGRDVTLLCAGQNGERASEDELAAHALYPLLADVIEGQWPPVASPFAWVADRAYIDGALLENRLREVLPETTGGRTLIEHGFGAGLVDCARADAVSVVAEARGRVVRALGQYDHHNTLAEGV